MHWESQKTHLYQKLREEEGMSKIAGPQEEKFRKRELNRTIRGLVIESGS